MVEYKPLNILVVDDEQEICTMFEKWLSLEGHRVKSALSGEEAINLVKKEYYDIVFLDIVMPGIQAVEVHKKINETFPKTKVVIITGMITDKDLLKEGKQKGAVGFVQKPFKMTDIMKTIRGLE